MPIRLCLEPRCHAPAHHRGRCHDHARTHNHRTHHPDSKRIYNSKRWQILRRWVLFDQPLCGCGQIATDVDHIQPIQQAGDPWAPQNLQALCQPCHSRKTMRELATR